MMGTEPDLSTATTEELWDELKTRFSGAVLCYDKAERDGKTARIEYWYKIESMAHAIGLVHSVYLYMRNQILADDE